MNNRIPSHPQSTQELSQHQQSLQQGSLVSSCRECALCKPVQSLPVIVKHALYEKYSSSQDFFYAKDITELLQQSQHSCYTHAIALYKQFQYMDDIHEQMRRVYSQQEFPAKMSMISQYYKFHRDVPMCYERSVEKIMGKYYGKVRQCDYKRIKRVLKEEQGISLTTQKSQSSFQDSHSTTQGKKAKKLHYSSLLWGLEQDQESRIVREVCGELANQIPIEKGIRKDFIIKGVYQSGQKQFQSFLDKQRIKSRKIKAHRSYKVNKNIHEGLGSSNQVQRGFKKPPTKNGFLGKSSLQRTTTDQIISREQKIKKNQKSQGLLIRNRIASYSKLQKNTNKLFRPLTSNLLALQSAEKIKTIDQIYKRSEPLTAQKYQSDKCRKSTSNFLGTNVSDKKVRVCEGDIQRSNKKLISYASKELRPELKTIDLRDVEKRRKSLNIRYNNFNQEPNINYNLERTGSVQRQMQLVRSSSKKSISVSKQPQRAKSSQKLLRNRGRSAADNPSYNPNQQQQRTLKTSSSKQLSPYQNTYGQSRSKSISKYESADIQRKNFAIERLLEDKLDILKKRRNL